MAGDLLEARTQVHGLSQALDAMQAAFPDNRKIQAQILNGSMGAAARKTFLETAKQLADRAEASGSLAESLKVRAMSKRRRAGRVAGMEVVPVRHDPKAIAKYISYYFSAQGKTPPADLVANGIRHGHLVEFGHDMVRGGKVIGHVPPHSFLWASTVRMKEYAVRFADEMKKRTEARVKREAKKAKK